MVETRNTRPESRLRVGILFGGRSAEHEVSVVSAQGVMAALDSERFQAVPIGVTKQGTWLTPPETERALTAIRSERFRRGLERLGGYDWAQTGRVLGEVA